MIGETKVLRIGVTFLLSLLSTRDPLSSTKSHKLFNQGESITLSGQLVEHESQMVDGHYFNRHSIPGREGDEIVIEMVSDDFDPYLRLFDSRGVEIASDDDAAGRQNAQVVVTLPSTGTYQVIAVANYENTGGAYTLSVRSAREDDFVQNEAIKKAYDLNLTINQLLNEARYEEVIPLANEALAIRREFFGENHPDVADILNNLAIAYQWQGEYDRSEALHKQALALKG